MRTRVLALLTLLPHLAMSFSAGPLAAFAAPRVKQAYASAAASPYSHLQTAPFEECLAAAPFFCDQVQQHPAKLEDEEISAGLLCLLSSSNGLRAFFLSYLSDPDFTVADSTPPPSSLLTSLDTVCSTASATKFVSQLLLQNIAMPVASTVAHRRASSSEGEAAATRSYRRAALLAGFIASSGSEDAVALPRVLRTEQAAFASSLQYEMTGGASGEKDFLWIGSIARWAYDQEQLTAIAEAITFDAVDVAPPLAEA